MTKNNALANIVNNKDCNINVTIGEQDDLSYDKIKKNYADVLSLENEFSDRLDFSKDTLTKKIVA